VGSELVEEEEVIDFFFIEEILGSLGEARISIFWRALLGESLES
jgi:hypothetical protein